jgi:hypothetical protein
LADEPRSSARNHGSVGEAPTLALYDVPVDVLVFDHQQLSVDSIDKALRKIGYLL